MSLPERQETLWLPPGVVHPRMVEFYAEVDLLSQPNDDGTIRMQDPAHQAYLQALKPRLGDPDFPVTNMLYRNVLVAYSDRSVHNIIQNGARSAAAYYIRKHYPYTLPLEKLNKPSGYDEYFEKFEQDADVQAYFALNYEYNVQTTVPQRIVPAIAAAFLLDRDNPFKIIDAGHGRGHPLLAAALPEKKFQFAPIEVMELTPSGELFVNSQAGKQFTEFVNQPFEVGESVGIDIEDEVGTNTARNQELAQWASQCFYVIKEYVNNFQRIIDYWILEDERGNFPQIRFWQDDITKFRHEAFQKAFPGYIADMALFLTVGNQIGADGMEQAMRDIGQYVDPKTGLVIAQEFADITPEGKVSLRTDMWPAFSYKTFVQDRAQPERGTQHFFTWENSRTRRVLFGRAAAELAVSKGIDLEYLPAA